MRLLRCVARAVLRNSGRVLCDLVPGGQALYDVAADAWQLMLEERRADALRAEVQALAQASAEEAREQARQIAQEVAGHEPPDIQLALVSYLSQVPATIRRSLKRPSDPGGTTVPPTRHLGGAEDLLPLLPAGLPRFRPGDRPLPGVDWVLDEMLGSGGFGEVWRARHRHLASKPPVALKFCLDEAAARALFNEAGVLDRVMRHGRHDGIVQLQETYLSAAPPCLQYEYVEGGDLSGLIREEAATGRLTAAAGTRLLLELARPVAFAHRAGIVHCDLKPANVLVQRGPDGAPRLRVADFGIGGVAAGQALHQARHTTSDRHTLLTEAVRGAYTPLYASPQQVQRRPGAAADPRDDVHALGVIWFQLVTGDLALTAVPADWREQLAERGMAAEHIELLGACITSREDRRLADAGVLVERLERPAERVRAAAGRAVPARAEEPSTHPLFLRGVLTLLAVGALAVIIVLVGVTLNSYVPPRPSPGDWKPGEAKPPKAGDEVSDALGIKCVYVPPGKFRMGSPQDEEGRLPNEEQHWVTLTRGFYLGKYEVTQAQWRAVMGKNPSKFVGDNLPVDNVSAEDCQEFLRRLRERTGKRYRLPTEAEWEYACRAGTTTRFHTGDRLGGQQANTFPGKEAFATAARLAGNLGGAPIYRGTMPLLAAVGANPALGSADAIVWRERSLAVGSLSANAWGLCDMHGNVREWCADSYAPYNGDATDPLSTRGNQQIVRGGSWKDIPDHCRSANRFAWDATFRDERTGFRVCCEAE
jgi:formylglycine-generating enzyme required for sulfatase activity